MNLTENYYHRKFIFIISAILNQTLMYRASQKKGTREFKTYVLQAIKQIKVNVNVLFLFFQNFQNGLL